MADRWKIVWKPQQRTNDQGENVGGLVVYVGSASGGETAVGQAAFDRSKSKNPDESFDDAVERIHAKARTTVRKLNEDLPDSEEME